jgi:hypothetical protein
LKNKKKKRERFGLNQFVLSFFCRFLGLFRLFQNFREKGLQGFGYAVVA